jgi:hypothetical protein
MSDIFISHAVADKHLAKLFVDFLKEAIGVPPLMVILDEKLIEDAKIAAIREKTKVSAVVEELLREWLSGRNR